MASIGRCAFFYCSKLTSVTIGNGVSAIGDFAFEGCSCLNNLTMGKSANIIGMYAFRGCYSLSSITIPDSMTSIGDGAFEKCTGLTSIIIPDGVTSIGKRAFINCTGLSEVIIGSRVTSIGDYAFGRCSSLSEVYYVGNETEWSKISIGSSNTELTNATIHYNFIQESEDNVSLLYNSGALKVNSSKTYLGVQLITALYQGNNLLSVTSASVDLTENTNTINSPVADYADADNVKFMLWRSIDSMQPLAATCTVDLKKN